MRWLNYSNNGLTCDTLSYEHRRLRFSAVVAEVEPSLRQQVDESIGHSAQASQGAEALCSAASPGHIDHLDFPSAILALVKACLWPRWQE